MTKIQNVSWRFSHKKEKERTQAHVELSCPSLLLHALCASFSLYVRIYPFLLPARRAITDFPVASASHSVLNMVESNHKCNQLFVTYFNIRQRIHRFLKGFWATEKSVNFSIHFTLRLFSKKMKMDTRNRDLSSKHGKSSWSYKLWLGRKRNSSLYCDKQRWADASKSKWKYHKCSRTHEPLILRLKLQGFFCSQKPGDVSFMVF